MTDIATLEPLTRTQTFELRSIVENICAAQDLSCAPHNHDAYLIDGAVYGLANLASHVAHVEPEQWPAEVDKWLTDMARLRSVAEVEVTAQNIFPRLVRSFDRPETADEYPVRQVLPGFDLIFAADYPTHVSELTNAETIGHIGPITDVYRVALENLFCLPVPAPHFSALQRSGSANRIASFEFDDFFAPSRLLYAADFLNAQLDPAEHGFLVAAPTRDLLAALPVDADEILDQVNSFANVVDSLYRDGPGSATPVTYHLTPSGELDIVAYLTDPDSLYFRPNEYLAEKFFNKQEKG